MTRFQCQFCAAYFTPPKFFRPPTMACDNCWLQIQAEIERQRQDETEARLRRHNETRQILKWVMQ